jgi:hypothetical protein
MREYSNLTELELEPESHMADDKRLREKALAAAAEEQRQFEQKRQEAKKAAARHAAEYRQKLIAAAITGMRDILGHETVVSDWKIGTRKYDDDGRDATMVFAAAVILGVEIEASRIDPVQFQITRPWTSGGLTLASFGRALESLDQHNGEKC